MDMPLALVEDSSTITTVRTERTGLAEAEGVAQCVTKSPSKTELQIPPVSELKIPAPPEISRKPEKKTPPPQPSPLHSTRLERHPRKTTTVIKTQKTTTSIKTETTKTKLLPSSSSSHPPTVYDLTSVLELANNDPPHNNGDRKKSSDNLSSPAVATPLHKKRIKQQKESPSILDIASWSRVNSLRSLVTPVKMDVVSLGTFATEKDEGSSADEFEIMVEPPPKV